MDRTLLTIELAGDADAVDRAMARIHVGAAVVAVVEHEDGRVEVALAEDEDRVRAVLAGVAVRWQVVPAFDGPPPTGLEDDRAVLVSPSLVVRPPWVPAPEGFSGIDLVVPRGMAFGSGEHGSTQAALLALEASWPAATPRSFADVGTGSGVLAAYARARGVRRIVACDIDEHAVRAARVLLPDADVRIGDARVMGRGSADAVAANLDDGQLDESLEAVLEVWNGVAPLVLSGMRANRADGHASRVGGRPDVRYERGGFVSLCWRGRGR